MSAETPNLRITETHDQTVAVEAVDARGLAVMLSASIRWIRTQDAAGRLPKPLRIAGKVLWRAGEIREWLEAGAPPRDEWEAIRTVRGGMGTSAPAKGVRT